MALTITQAGSAGNGTTETATVVTPVTASIGDTVLVKIAADNAQVTPTDGGPSIASVTDSAGNTYTQRSLVNFNAGGGERTGVTVATYTSVLTSALAAAAVTVNFSPSTVDKAVQVTRIQPGVGNTLSFIAADNTGTTGTSAATAGNTVSVTNGDTIFGLAGLETGSNDFSAGDSDTTNGNWSAAWMVASATGAGNANITLVSQHKTVNATGNQTHNTTIAASRDWVTSYIIFREVSSGISLAADAGSYALTGQTASLEYGREVAASSGNYTFTGSTASLEYGREVAGDSGAYAFTGTSADLVISAEKVILADSGVYAWSGQAASLEVGRILTADGSSYSWSGQAASLEYGFEVEGQSGSYTFTGATAQLLVVRSVTATSGAYLFTGSDATLEHLREIAALGGSYAFTGAEAAFITGGTVNMTFSVTEAASLSPSISTGANMGGSIRIGAHHSPALER